ncbi:MAG: hypothetical protein H3C62_17745, partial [Gemmatimonadaceae bacterium]|nr:hypothetical protein [Gemmatimonadaceae bacterium]
MRRFLVSFTFAVLAVLAACAPGARRGLAPATPDAREPLLISAAQLDSQRGDPALVLLHVGTPADYAAAHLPGARLAPLAQLTVSDTVRKISAEMPSADTLRARLAALGVGDRSRIVVYTGKDQWYQTARVLFTLYYAGLGERAVLLDGGLPAWVAAGLPITTGAPSAVRGALSPLKLRDFVVSADEVQKSIGARGISIVDARDAEFYTG